MGDWKAHNPAWDPTSGGDAAGGGRDGRVDVEKVYEVRRGDEGPTWERVVEGRRKEGRIDFFISTGPME